MRHFLGGIALMFGAALAGQEQSTQHSAPSTQHSSQTITVTATRTETRLADTPASVVVLSREVLDSTAAPTLDDALRQVPGFTLFRRSGSRVANPTSQGLSLRGIGGSGASRAIVLDDGIPLNDAFGGWVYWSRVPQAALERVEVVRGGGSDLYGSAAMGGVIQFIRRRHQPLTAEVWAGSQATGSGSVLAGARLGRWNGRIAAASFETAGYVMVEPASRGDVDRRADSHHDLIEVTLAREQLFLRASRFEETRNNGTPLQVNETTHDQLALGTTLGSFSARGWVARQSYEQMFSAIAADRNSERLTVEQRVPSRNAGTSVQWARPFGARHALLAGLEARQVSGTSDEIQGSTRTASFGRQRTVGLFLEDIFVVTPALSLTAGLRHDDWRNVDARRNGQSLPQRDDSAWSPRLAALYRPSARAAFTVSAYRAFRAPTLNELYRGFRVGNVETLANESLAAEHLSALEMGVRSGDLRLTLFWMQMDDVIANVTLSSTPGLITRQRQNVASSRTRGVELEATRRAGPRWRLSAGYLFSDARVTAGELERKRLPQVPRHQATGQVIYSARLTAALQARWSVAQFDDDLNRLPLDGYFVVDGFLSHPIGGDFDVTFAVENMFDQRVEVSATPVITLGQPRSIRAGLRYGR